MSDNTAAGRRPVSRRAEYAEATRQAIIDAARTLFGEKGFFATKVDDIAAAARVAPATVYAVGGGKQGLLGTLMDVWTTAPIVADNIERIGRLEDAHAILRTVATVTREMRQEFGDIMRVMIATAPHDPGVAESLATATARYRAGNGFAARRMADLGALRPGLDARDAEDILWLYFGYAGFFALVDDNKWSYEKAERWLLEASSHALFGDAGALT
ncbi:TetR/AcrR family transcriptional regulator [Planotetraspora mira]|uniref:TetR family transcriptional regulator n=1 Tax=Planotetraspora mira TaxID=58121 RepID=A0A8J3X4S0_9ACTN|nr:TetR/AcrR family transcriptional regulator [Planotetraspora mira]GII27997.1 TetR family transcriptional regulator [Planotetraspora mira]